MIHGGKLRLCSLMPFDKFVWRCFINHLVIDCVCFSVYVGGRISSLRVKLRVVGEHGLEFTELVMQYSK